VREPILIQLLSTDASDRATVFVRIFPVDFSYVRTKSDTVISSDQRVAELKQLKIDIVNCTCGRTRALARGRWQVQSRRILCKPGVRQDVFCTVIRLIVKWSVLFYDCPYNGPHVTQPPRSPTPPVRPSVARSLCAASSDGLRQRSETSR